MDSPNSNISAMAGCYAVSEGGMSEGDSIDF